MYKILIIGVKNPYSAEYFFQRAFKRLDHEAVLLDQYMGVNSEDLTRIVVSRFKTARVFLERLPINRFIVKRFRLDRYDLILVFKGELLSDQSLSILSDYNTWLFYPDTFRFRVLLVDRIHFFRGVFVTTDRHSYYYSIGARRVHTIWWACDPEIHKPYAEQKIYDVSFIGTFYPNRYIILRRLRVKPHIFGKYWILKAGIHHPPVYGEAYARIVARTKNKP